MWWIPLCSFSWFTWYYFLRFFALLSFDAVFNFLVLVSLGLSFLMLHDFVVAHVFKSDVTVDVTFVSKRPDYCLSILWFSAAPLWPHGELRSITFSNICSVHKSTSTTRFAKITYRVFRSGCFPKWCGPMGVAVRTLPHMSRPSLMLVGIRCRPDLLSCRALWVLFHLHHQPVGQDHNIHIHFHHLHLTLFHLHPKLSAILCSPTQPCPATPATPPPMVRHHIHDPMLTLLFIHRRLRDRVTNQEFMVFDLNKNWQMTGITTTRSMASHFLVLFEHRLLQQDLMWKAVTR